MRRSSVAKPSDPPPPYEETNRSTNNGGEPAAGTLAIPEPPYPLPDTTPYPPPPPVPPPRYDYYDEHNSYQSSTNTIFIQGVPLLGPKPQELICPYCRCNITSRTESSAGPTAWFLGMLICLVGCWPFACIPCFLEPLRETEHFCPVCKAFLGRHVY